MADSGLSRRARQAVGHIYIAGPRACPKCGGENVTGGHTNPEREPVWVCDRQACGIVVCWRYTE